MGEYFEHEEVLPIVENVIYEIGKRGREATHEEIVRRLRESELGSKAIEAAITRGSGQTEESIAGNMAAWFSQKFTKHELKEAEANLTRRKVSGKWAYSLSNPVTNSPAPNTELKTLGTEIQRLIWMRKNQSKFSNPVKRFWKGRCAVTNIEAESILQACHIKPFSQSDDDERLNTYNGICLSANIHGAFDAHLIGFAPNGEICFSNRLSHEDRRRMGLNGVSRIELSDAHARFIEHRYAQFLGTNSSGQPRNKGRKPRL